MGKLWFGGTIYPMTGEGETVEAIFTKDGKIVETGHKDELQNKYNEEIDETVPFEGVLFPGFIDSHLHIIGHGEKLLRLDLSDIHSRQDVINKVHNAIQNVKGEQWIIGEGFNENNWDEPTFIHKEELDEITGGNPVILTRVCRHALVANSKVMDLAGVNEQTQDVPGGVIERDSYGYLTGAFHDQAQDLIKEKMPVPSISFLEHAIETSINDLLSHGIVSGHSEDLSYYGGFKKTFDAFNHVIPTKQFFRAHLLVHHDAVDDLHHEGYRPSEIDDWLEFGAMKLFVDGALGGRTALLSEPYSDDSTRKGVSIHTDQQLEGLVMKARNYHMPIAVHTIGDQAVEKIVRLIEKYPPPQNTKDRIIHAQIMRPDLIERLKELPIIIDVQPTFVASDFPWVVDRVGQERASQSYPWKTYMDEGILCAGGSDAPIEEVDPLLGIDAAVNRRSAYDGQTYYEHERLSVYEAFCLYTVNPAKVINKEGVQGQLKRGFFADFVVLDHDPFKIDQSKLSTLNVNMTIVNEKIVYKR
ncbi:amidohydrolase [Tenuibacillus multivorans]|uniref:Amidohydrolase 3 domain-containing protein n=1 Tax=Tenuibacillus multivorans TaxID=237069 RepID=A0A1G9ZWE2_9BACI|nr:amidohydrolase [Tenuibacillus multivorans]GEL76875.1 amidohydrolase [Tenuibacillus multivorans]SDN25444.1 hypothetical protein SAMN05216498_1867 [Tenuibacillus multivorans]